MTPTDHEEHEKIMAIINILDGLNVKRALYIVNEAMETIMLSHVVNAGCADVHSSEIERSEYS